jgi:hypothetical protein
MASQELLDEKLAAANAVVNEYVTTEASEAVYMSGSLMAGLGTSYSDIDIFVITGQREGSVQRGNGKDRIDVQFRSPEWLTQAAALGEPFKATRDDNYPQQISEALVDDTVRLLVGKDLKASEALLATRSSLKKGKKNLQELIISQLTFDLASYWMDALGFIESGDIPELELVSQQIFLTAIDAVCVAEGDLYRGDKWVWGRARRCKYLANAQPWILDLLTGRAVTPGSGELAIQRMLTAQKLISLALLREWSSGSYPEAPENALAANHGLTRSPYWVPLRLSESAYLINQDTQHFTVSELALACWAAADGVSRDELKADISLTYEEESAEQIYKTIDGLTKIGAILTIDKTWPMLISNKS